MWVHILVTDSQSVQLSRNAATTYYPSHIDVTNLSRDVQRLPCPEVVVVVVVEGGDGDVHAAY